MDLNIPSAQAIRDKLAVLLLEINASSKTASGLENTIVISRRKNNMLLKDVHELKRRRDEQSTMLTKEENKLFSLAKELSHLEEKANLLEMELSDLLQVKDKLHFEIKTRTDTIKEHDILLSLYEGCDIW
ncbi:hypothetical protein NEOKW01_0253 [Nematocida sp. AWRm80]|nr:hypothetical protein NEOKW01_0253 [Nematocida sp. AWRm80]